MSGRRVRALVRRIAEQFRRDRRTLGLIVVVPVAILGLVGWVIRDQAVPPTDVVVVNEDAAGGAPLSRALLDASDPDAGFDVALEAGTEADARRALVDQDLDLAVVIPPGFGVDLLAGRQPALRVVTLGLNPGEDGGHVARFQQAMTRATRALLPAEFASHVPSLERATVYGSPEAGLLDAFAPVFVGFFAYFFVFLLTGVSFLRERVGGTLEEQARDALRTIERVSQEEGTRGSIVHQAVFLSDKDRIDECRQIMRKFYGHELPATTYIPQHPCDGKLLSIEALGVGCRQGEVQILRCAENLVITRHSGVSWIHVGQVLPDAGDAGVYGRSLSAFRKMHEVLKRAGVDFSQVVRTWLYLGDIVGPEADTQRYKELNRARTDYYEGICFGAGHLPPGINGAVYPASTGIGTDNHDILMSCIAIATDRDDLTIVPLENPLQTSAFDYSCHYGPKSPKFARALALASGQCATIFVSGTASITDSESRFLDDPGRQTHQTLDNIAALISEHNFDRHHMPGLGATLDDLALVRVYIKRQEDYQAIRAVCEARLGELPTIYAVADVCRPELLVEIEGIAFSHRVA